jgi:hypothetical protein
LRGKEIGLRGGVAVKKGTAVFFMSLSVASVQPPYSNAQVIRDMPAARTEQIKREMESISKTKTAEDVSGVEITASPTAPGLSEDTDGEETE